MMRHDQTQASVLAVEEELRQLQRVNDELRAQLQERFRFDSIIGTGRQMTQVFSTLELVAPMQSTVLIQGETGTGKELIARSIHFNSARKDQPFVSFNATAIPEDLAEAEFFCRIAMAGRGTLFLDEVASMPLALQKRLLGALGARAAAEGDAPASPSPDARCIAATSVDLLQLVKDGGFREDLYYRLNVVRVMLPPLRTRREDIPILAQHFARRASQHIGIAPRMINADAMILLMDHAWPGNIRQLEDAVEHAVAMSGGGTDILPDMLPEEFRRLYRPRKTPIITIPDEGVNFSSVMAEIERDLILQCLERTGGNKRQAAKLLNLSRTTLIDKLQRLGIGVEDPPAAIA